MPLSTAGAQTYDWGGMAIISATMGVNANQLCMGEGTRGDIGCPSWTPSVTTAGLEVSGTVTATRFLGDGSGLTGLNAANVSVTTGGSGSIVFRDAYGSLMASSGLSISSTTGSVGIGAGPANVGNYGLYVVGSTYVGGNATANGTLYAGGLLTANTGVLVNTGSVAITGGPVLAISNGVPLVRAASGFTDPSLSLSGGPSMPEALRIVSTGYVGIGTNAPTTRLEVNGVVSMTDAVAGSWRTSSTSSGYAMLGNRNYTTNGDFRDYALMVKNSGEVNLRSSGSSYLLVGQNGGGASTGMKFDTSGMLLGTNASALASLSASATVHVSGSLLITSWTYLNAATGVRVTPTVPLEVSGTISATALIVNGVPITGAVASATVYDGASGSIVYRDGTGNLTASSTLSVSATTGSVGIGAGAPASLGSYGLYAAGSIKTNGSFQGTNFFPANGYGVFWGTGNTSQIVGNGGAGTDYLAFTTSGTEAMRIVSTGYVGIGTSTPKAALHVSGTLLAGATASAGSNLTGAPLEVVATGYSSTLVVNRPGIGLAGIAIGGFPTVTFGWSVLNGGVYQNQAVPGYISIASNTGYVAINNSYPSQTLHVAGTALTTSWTGINFSSYAKVTPTAPLEVSGTLSATTIATPIITDAANGAGIISVSAVSLKFKGASGALGFYRYGDPLWMADTWYDTTNSSTEAFRIGTSNLIPAWLIRSQNGYPIILNTVSGSVIPGVAVGGWGTNAPTTLSATLFVKGSQITTSWTSIGFNDSSRAATAPLEVNGTVSATALIINGQSITAGATTTFASLTDVSYSATGYNIFGPGSLTGAVAGVTGSTAFGVESLFNPLNQGFANSAFGAKTLKNNTTGYYNSGLGYFSLINNATGNFNTAVGASAMNLNTTGSDNAALGTNSLQYINGSGNSVVGSAAMASVRSGSRNVAMGFDAGLGSVNAVVTNSVFIGAYSGQSVTSATNNTFVGYVAGGRVTSGNSNTLIGAGASPYSNTGNNQLAIANAIWGDTGNGDTLRAKIGINVTSPTTSLEVSGTVSATTLSAISGGNGQIVPQWTAANWSAQLVVGGSRNPAIALQPAFGYTGTVSTVAIVNGLNGFSVARVPALGDSTTAPTTLLTISASNAYTGINTYSPLATLHVNGTGILTNYTAVNLSRVAVAPLEVSGTVSATRFVGDGSGLTGITAAANDNIASGTAYVKALLNTGASISGSLAIAGPVSATGDVKGNTLQLVDAPADTCSTANAGAIKRANGRFYYCRP